MYGLNRLKSAVPPPPPIRNEGGKISRNENQSRRNDRNKTYKRKVLPPELSRHTAMLTCESAADGGVCDVYLVGINHVSAKFAQKAKAVIEFLKPQVVFLELCSSRRDGILPPQKRKFGAVEVLNGAEFHLAYEEAMKYGAKVVLGDRPDESSKLHHPLPLTVGDRPVEITMRRTWANMSLWQKTKLRSSELFEAVCMLSPEYVTKKLKELDDGDMLPPAFQEMSKRFPALMETLVHERDQYMSATLLRVAREHNSVVAVVGMGHLVGIQKNWKQPVDLKKLLSMPPEKKRIPVGNILFYVAATVYIISGIYRSINT
ncbi:hypothetical protein C2S52_008126 [Perilla frutescens var. hirtella]|nr:hypothetical protein C2S52_008126 [Perilla frutescens var. hirtella]